MQRGIVDADNGNLTTVRGNEGGLIDQERDFVAIGEFAVPIDWYAAVMIVITQGHEDRRDLAQAGEKSEHVRQSLRYVEQVTGDKNPVGVKPGDGGNDAIVPWLITVEMQIAQMNGPTPGQKSVLIGQSRNLVCGQSDFPGRNETKEPIERFA